MRAAVREREAAMSEALGCAEAAITTCKESINVLGLAGRPPDTSMDDSAENLGDDKYLRKRR